MQRSEGGLFSRVRVSKLLTSPLRDGEALKAKAKALLLYLQQNVSVKLDVTFGETFFHIFLLHLQNPEHSKSPLSPHEFFRPARWG